MIIHILNSTNLSLERRGHTTSGFHVRLLTATTGRRAGTVGLAECTTASWLKWSSVSEDTGVPTEGFADRTTMAGTVRWLCAIGTSPFRGSSRVFIVILGG